MFYPFQLTLRECRSRPVTYGVTGELMAYFMSSYWLNIYLLFTVLPDHLVPFFEYTNGAINVQGLNSMIASNGTTGMIMVCTHNCVDMICSLVFTV